MKEELKQAKKKMKDESRAYSTYGYYISIPAIFIILMILSVLGFDNNNLGGLLFIFTVIANVNAKKLELVSRRKYVAPVLLYISNVLSFLLLPALFFDFSMGGAGDTYFVLLGLIVFPIQILMIIFFFISANDIKKSYPTMKEVAKRSRENYMKIKKARKQRI